MRSPTRALAFGAVAALALLLAALFLLQGEGGSGGTEALGTSGGTSSGEPEAPLAPHGPEGALESAGAARSAPSPDLAVRRTNAVRGRLVTKGDEKPVSGALVTLRTEEERIDYPETLALLGGADVVASLRREGIFEEGLRAVGGWKPVHAGRSGADGAFSIAVPPELPQFRFEVDAEFARASEASARWFAVGSPEVEAGITLRLDPAGEIEGTLRSASGRPVAGGRASASPGGWGGRGVDADAAGRFSIRGLAPGRYGIAALGEGCGPASRADLDVRAGEVTRVDLDLPPESFLSGRVVDEEGRGVARARVDARPNESLGSNPQELRYGRAITDAEGRFRVGSLRSGKHDLVAFRVGRLSPKAETVDVPAGSGVADLRLVLAGGRSLAGRVFDASRAPVVDAEVTARTDRAAQRSRGVLRMRGSSPQSTVTAADGTFRLAGLDEGPYVVSASLQGRGRAERREVSPEVEELLLVLEATGAIVGKVRDAETGEPVLRFEVGAERRDPSRGPNFSEGQGGRPFSTKDGSFELRDRKPGTHELAVRARGYLAEKVKGIEVKAGETTGGLEVALRRGASIRGRIVDRASGAPVPDAAVVADPVETGEETEISGENVEGEPSGLDGSFETAGLVPGTWRVWATREGFVRVQTDPVRVGERQTIDGVVIAFSRGGAIDGFAVGPDGNPLAGGRASASPSDRSGGGFWMEASLGYLGRGGRGAIVDASGYFRLEGLEPGKYLVQAQPARTPGEPRAEIQRKTLRGHATVEEGRVGRVEFAEAKGGCLVRGRVLRGNEAVEGVDVSLVPKEWPKDQEVRSMLQSRLGARSGPDGSFEVPHAPAGEARVSARTSSGGTVDQTVTVPETGTLAVELRFPLGEIAGRVVAAADRSPVPNVPVTALRADEGEAKDGKRSAVTTGEDGRYRIRDLAPGSYRVRAEAAPAWSREEKHATLAPEERGPFDVSEGSPTLVDLALPNGGKVLVTVRDSEGKPRSDVQVQLRAADAKSGSRTDEFGRDWFGRGAQTGQDGTAHMLGVPAGRYFVTAWFDGYANCPSEERAVRLGEETAFQVDLREGTRLRVRLLGPDARRVKNGWVNLTDARGVESVARLERAEDSGSEERGLLLARLLPGSYAVRGSVQGFRTYEGTVVVGSASPQDLEIRLEREETQPADAPR
ncbi:MAG TPA: carboxypeptidase regulatory-like domain-containing protein [Planctomycetota bacterium]|nr:carboxypeptidase regulatory-like domain-containing protein [Planctomycetota bacterium]